MIEITNDHDLDQALEQIDALWNALPGTADYDDFMDLVAAVEVYEDKHYPIPEPSKWAMLMYHLDQAQGYPWNVLRVMGGGVLAWCWYRWPRRTRAKQTQKNRIAVDKAARDAMIYGQGMTLTEVDWSAKPPGVTKIKHVPAKKFLKKPRRRKR